MKQELLHLRFEQLKRTLDDITADGYDRWLIASDRSRKLVDKFSAKEYEYNVEFLTKGMEERARLLRQVKVLRLHFARAVEEGTEALLASTVDEWNPQNSRPLYSELSSEFSKQLRYFDCKAESLENYRNALLHRIEVIEALAWMCHTRSKSVILRRRSFSNPETWFNELDLTVGALQSLVPHFKALARKAGAIEHDVREAETIFDNQYGMWGRTPSEVVEAANEEVLRMQVAISHTRAAQFMATQAIALPSNPQAPPKETTVCSLWSVIDTLRDKYVAKLI